MIIYFKSGGDNAFVVSIYIFKRDKYNKVEPVKWVIKQNGKYVIKNTQIYISKKSRNYVISHSKTYSQNYGWKPNENIYFLIIINSSYS